MQIATVELALSIKDTLKQPTMRSVFKDKGQLAYGVVNVLVTRFVGAFAFSTKMDKTQIETLTVDTLDRFTYETLDDVILFFKMCRSGQLGTTKRAVDSNLIFGEWFPKYLELKTEEREALILEEKKATTQNKLTDDQLQKAYYKSSAHRREAIVQERLDEFTKNMDRQMLEDTILSWQNDLKYKPYLKLLKKKRRSIPWKEKEQEKYEFEKSASALKLKLALNLNKRLVKENGELKNNNKNPKKI